MIDQNIKTQLRKNLTRFPKRMIFGPIVCTPENEKLVRFLYM